jgi:hypothetical protein
MSLYRTYITKSVSDGAKLGRINTLRSIVVVFWNLKGNLKMEKYSTCVDICSHEVLLMDARAQDQEFRGWQVQANVNIPG